jgi:hypothetical protein
MSEKRVEELLRRLDETLIILKDVLSDLQEISKSLRSTTVAPTPAVPAPSVQMSQPAPPAKPAPAPAPHTRSIKDVQVMFPSELEDLLTFTEREGYIIIKPRQYLGSENFAKIASIIRGAGGEYISAGKDSHFRIPKQYE